MSSVQENVTNSSLLWKKWPKVPSGREKWEAKILFGWKKLIFFNQVWLYYFQCFCDCTKKKIFIYTRTKSNRKLLKVKKSVVNLYSLWPPNVIEFLFLLFWTIEKNSFFAFPTYIFLLLKMLLVDLTGQDDQQLHLEEEGGGSHCASITPNQQRTLW